MKSLRIEFPNAEGLPLAGRLELPEDEQPKAYALFAHCFTCGKDLKAAVRIARALCARRIAVLRFDFAGIGESGGEFSATNFSSNVADLLAAAAYLEREYASPQLLIGHSLGGAAVLRAALDLPAVRAVATIGAPFEPGHLRRNLGGQLDDLQAQAEVEVTIAGRHLKLRREFLSDLERQQPGQVLQQLRAALLVLHSPVDQTVAIDQARQIYQAARHPKSFVSLDDADHLLSRVGDALYAADVIAIWAERYLKVADEPGIASAVIDNRVTARTGSEGFFTELFANGHALVADEPKSYGGSDRGPTPYDYLLAALGACTSMTVQMYAGRKQWPLKWAVTRLQHAKIHASDCAECEQSNGKIDRFERELELVGDLDAEQRQRLLEIAEKCPVHKSLHSEVEVVTLLKEEQ